VSTAEEGRALENHRSVEGLAKKKKKKKNSTRVKKNFIFFKVFKHIIESVLFLIFSPVS